MVLLVVVFYFVYIGFYLFFYYVLVVQVCDYVCFGGGMCEGFDFVGIVFWVEYGEGYVVGMEGMQVEQDFVFIDLWVEYVVELVFEVGGGWMWVQVVV